MGEERQGLLHQSGRGALFRLARLTHFGAGGFVRLEIALVN